MFSKERKKYIFWIIAVALISAAFHGLALTKTLPWWVVYSDVFGFYDRATAPGFPYISKLIEYPVLIGFFIQLAGAFGKSKFVYFLIQVILLAGAAALTTYLLYRLAPEKYRKNLWRYWIFAPSAFVFLVYNWDILAILFVIAAFYFMQKNRDYSAAFFLALGASTKFFPVFYLVPLLLKKQYWSERLKIIGVFSGVTLLLNGYFILYHSGPWSYFFRLNSGRDPNLDSIWEVFRFFVWPLDVAQINTISFVLFAAVFLYLMLEHRKYSTIKLCFLTTLLFLLVNKVFSPQYILWLLPFFVISESPTFGWFYGLELANLAALYSIVPWYFFGHNNFYFYLATPFVLIRHIALLKIFIQALKIKS